MKFTTKLQYISEKNNSLLCVGLDPDLAKMPDGVDVATFCKNIIQETSPYVCAYKPNMAFFEALGDEGVKILRDVLSAVPKDIVTICDGKRGDIGNTSSYYAHAIFDDLGFDAATVNPYMGYDSVEPFLKYTDKGVIILCHTSNAGAADFQQLKLNDGHFLYEMVAKKARDWDKHHHVALVTGAVEPAMLKHIRFICPDMLLLIPGVGAQGGDVKQVVHSAKDKNGSGFMINSSRQIIYASSGDDYAQKAGQAAKTLRDEINKYR